MIIQVEARSVYGNVLIYPVNDAAKVAAELVGKKSFSANDLKLLARLGHEIQEIAAPRLRMPSLDHSDAALRNFRYERSQSPMAEVVRNYLDAKVAAVDDDGSARAD